MPFGTRPQPAASAPPLPPGGDEGDGMHEEEPCEWHDASDVQPATDGQAPSAPALSGATQDEGKRKRPLTKEEEMERAERWIEELKKEHGKSSSMYCLCVCP